MRTSVMLAPLPVAVILLVLVVTLVQCDPRKARLRNSWWSKKSVASPRPTADQRISRHLGAEGTLALPGGVLEEADSLPSTGEATLGSVDPYAPRLADASQGSADLLFLPRPGFGDDGDDDDQDEGGDDGAEVMSLGEIFSPYIRSSHQTSPSGCNPALPAALSILSRLHAHLSAHHHPHAQAILLARLQSLASKRPIPGHNLRMNSDPALTWANRSQQ
ncbi:uncharacterized protein [Panulirus ornatus]|uniref:uncharacterized protein n=1 Tax=Panulirus ornatus TaxID=150431 RepID=UPI003A8A48C9